MPEGVVVSGCPPGDDGRQILEHISGQRQLREDGWVGAQELQSQAASREEDHCQACLCPRPRLTAIVYQEKCKDSDAEKGADRLCRPALCQIAPKIRGGGGGWAE